MNISYMPMEPDIKEFLKKVLTSLSIGLLWLIINMTFGIYFEWLFFEDHLTTGNYIFYSFMIISLAALIIFYFHLWRNK